MTTFDPNVFIFLGKSLEIRFETKLENSYCLHEKEGYIRVGFDIGSPQRRAVIYKNEARRLIIPYVYDTARKLGLNVNKVSIRGQKTLWGTCSRRGNISINWKIMLSPRFVVTYLVAHELVHLIHPNHGKEYKATLNRIYPRVAESKEWLKKHDNYLRIY